MKERLAPILISAQPEILKKPQEELTLRESLVGKRGKLSKKLTSVARMINYLDIDLLEKRQLFFYHLWQEELSLGPIKEFIEIREDLINFIVDPVLKNNRLVEAYEDFHKRYEEKNRTKSRSQEKMDEILPLRGPYSIAEISRRTGYTEDYIKSVFKRALKKGIIKPLDKKEIAQRARGYDLYLRIKSGVREIRKTSSFTDSEIAQKLSEQLQRPVTKQQVKRQIRMLLREEKIERRINQIK